MTLQSNVKPDEKKKEGWGEAIRTVIYAVAIALVIRSLAYEPFNIPSGSMLPTLLIGDYLFVSKYPYGYSRHSFPFSPPVMEGRVWESPVERGDIVVFKLPRDNSTDYIKRIVGLPGDKLQVSNGLLLINGKPVQREFMGNAVVEGEDRRGPVRKFRETLPNGRSYITLDLYDNSDGDNTEVFTVPAEHYFAMGDNRDNSSDSRFAPERGGVGYIPAENLVGRAEFRFFSISGDARFWEVWKWPSAIRFSRIFTSVD